MKVKCIDAWETNLVAGQVYEVAREQDEFYYLVVPSNKFRTDGGWLKSRFEVVTEAPVKMKVKCIDTSRSKLIAGKVYDVTSENTSFYFLASMPGYEAAWLKSRFEIVKERKLLGYRVKTPDGKYLRYGNSLEVRADFDKPKVVTQHNAVAMLYHWVMRGNREGDMVKVYRKEKGTTHS